MVQRHVGVARLFQAGRDGREQRFKGAVAEPLPDDVEIGLRLPVIQDVRFGERSRVRSYGVVIGHALYYTDNGTARQAAGLLLRRAIMTVDLKKTDNCFVCGRKNGSGLHAEFEIDARKRSIRGRFTPRPDHEGWQGIVHGGIIASLLDEAMVKLAAHLGIAAVSAEMTVKFKAPAAPGQDLVILGRIVETRNRLVLAESAISRGDVVIAEATGKLLKL